MSYEFPFLSPPPKPIRVTAQVGLEGAFLKRYSAVIEERLKVIREEFCK